MLSALRRYFEYQVRYEKRATNPFAAVRSLKRDQRLPDFFFEEEMEQLLALPDESFLGKRDRAILELLYSTGCRVAELVSINISGLNYKRQSIRIVGKGNKERFVFIGREAMRALDAYLLVREEHVDRNDPDAVQALFINSRGGRITTRGVFYIIRKYIEMAGVPKKVGPHTFRHSFATHVLDRGADIRAVQELLGHSSLSTTQVYTHLGLDRLKKIYRKAHPHARKRSMT
jgi:integrase/recombinase XerC/integrase/recombinase XerD